MTEDTSGCQVTEDTPENPAEGSPELMARLNANLGKGKKPAEGGEEKKAAGSIPPGSRQEQDNNEFERLSKLSDADYDREREGAAEKLGIRVTTLDREVARRKPKKESDNLQGQSIAIIEREPWPEKVDGATLLDEIVATIKRYIILKNSDAVIIALWLVASYAFMEFFIFPRLRIKSPVPGCGKSTLLDILECLVNRPHKVDNATVATLSRVIEQYRPTQLLDETDAWLKDDKDNEKRGIINAGHKKNGAVERCVGDNQEVRWFFVYCPMILAGIGKLAGTIEDRSVSILLQKKKSTDKVARFRADRPGVAIANLARKICRFAEDHATEIGEADPDIPESIFNRAADNFRPLLAVADAAGGKWPKEAREVMASAAKASDSTETEARLSVLADIKGIFEDTAAPKVRERSEKSGAPIKCIHSQVLVDALIAIEGGRWAEYNRGKALTQTGLAHLLSDYLIKPYQMRIGTENKKGYDVAVFDDAFASYLAQDAAQPSTPPVQTETSKHCYGDSDNLQKQTETSDFDVSVQNGENANDDNDVSDVSVCTPPVEGWADMDRGSVAPPEAPTEPQVSLEDPQPQSEPIPEGPPSVPTLRIIGQGDSCDVCARRTGDVYVYAPGSGRKAEALCPEHARAWGVELGQPVDPIPAKVDYPSHRRLVDLGFNALQIERMTQAQANAIFMKRDRPPLGSGRDRDQIEF
jgi:putative DNA primase/helicase